MLTQAKDLSYAVDAEFQEEKDKEMIIENFCGLIRKQGDEGRISVWSEEDLMKVLPSMDEADDYILAVNHGYRAAMKDMADLIMNRHLAGEGMMEDVPLRSGEFEHEHE